MQNCCLNPLRQTVLVIDTDPTARAIVRRAAHQLGWATIEAPDGITGIDMLNTHLPDLVLIVLEFQMVDMDGYDTIVRLRDITREHQMPIPLLPFTGVQPDSIFAMPHVELFLQRESCAPILEKPAPPEALSEAMRAAAAMPVRFPTDDGDRVYARHRAAATERRVREGRTTLRVAALATAPASRAWLRATLPLLGVQLIEVPVVGMLRQAFVHTNIQALVADVADRQAAVSAAAHYQVPLLLVATTEEHVVAVVEDRACLAAARGVVAVLDDNAPQVLAEALYAIIAGERAVLLPPQLLFQALPVPDELRRYEWKVVWLELHGWTDEQIIKELEITVGSYKAYWRRIFGQVGADRAAVRQWARAYLRARHLASTDARQLQERAV